MSLSMETIYGQGNVAATLTQMGSEAAEVASMISDDEGVLMGAGGGPEHWRIKLLIYWLMTQLIVPMPSGQFG